MFLHALLFFLLSPSVFAAPAGSSSRGHGNDESYVGYWYPVEAKGTALGGLPQILQIVSETILYDRKLKEDGSLDERQSARTRIPTNKPDAITAILAPRVLWRRFPKGGTAYADLKYLKIQKGNGQQLTFNSPSLNEATGEYIVDWVGRYWYKITESGETPYGPLVLQFNEHQDFVAFRVLRSKGGVQLAPNGFNPTSEMVTGDYVRVPNPHIDPGPYHDVMTVEDRGGYIISVKRYMLLPPE